MEVRECNFLVQPFPITKKLIVKMRHFRKKISDYHFFLLFKKSKLFYCVAVLHALGARNIPENSLLKIYFSITHSKKDREILVYLYMSEVSMLQYIFEKKQGSTPDKNMGV